MNVPNTITLARLLSVPFIAWLVVLESYGWALVAFALAGLSDAVDGLLARVLDQRTPLGATLDPAADKLLLVMAFASLWWVGRIPGWLLSVVLVRDLVLSGAYWGLFAMGRRLPVRPTGLGKVTTVAQLALVTWLLWAAAAPAAREAPPDAPGWLPVLVALVTVVSGLHYLWIGYGVVRGDLKQA